jgi:hypothetical protein
VATPSAGGATTGSDSGLVPPVVPARADRPATPAHRAPVAPAADASPATHLVLQGDASPFRPYAAPAASGARSIAHAAAPVPVIFHHAPPSPANPFLAKITPAGGGGFGGSSLLAVLAGYVLPGGGTMPGSTLFLFLMQLGLLALVAFAPARRGFERVVAIGLLAGRPGHQMAVRRPG